MKILQILSQYGRDFRAIYECQYCRAVHKGTGCDDAYFHNEVIPAMACKECGKSTKLNSGDIPKPSRTKYPEGMQV